MGSYRLPKFLFAGHLSTLYNIRQMSMKQLLLMRPSRKTLPPARLTHVCLAACRFNDLDTALVGLGLCPAKKCDRLLHSWQALETLAGLIDIFCVM